MKTTFFGTGLVLSAVVLLGAGCIKHPYEVGQAPPRQKTPPVSTTTDTTTVTKSDDEVTAGWKTFANDASGLTFKYPSTWPTPEFKDVTIDLGPAAGIDLIDPAWFNNNYEGCLKKEEADYCKKMWGRDQAQFKAMMDYVAGKSFSLSDFHVGCDMPNHYLSTSMLFNSNLSAQTQRAVYFCGVDVSIDNYVYYVPYIINNKLVEIRLPLFPRDSAVRAWAIEAMGGEDTSPAADFAKFSKDLEQSLQLNQPHPILAVQLREYDLLAKSVTALN